MIFLFFFPLSLICLLLTGPLTLTSLSLFSFFSLSASTLSVLCFSHLISFLFHGRTHRSAVLCIMSADQSWVEWVSGLDAPGLWRSFHGWTVGGIDLVGQSSLSLTLYDLYRRWFFFVSSGFCDFDKWVLDLWIWVGWWWWLDLWIFVVWLDDGDWVGWWWIFGFGFLEAGWWWLSWMGMWISLMVAWLNGMVVGLLCGSMVVAGWLVDGGCGLCWVCEREMTLGKNEYFIE